MPISKLPGCYGLPSAHNLNTETCSNCPLRQRCRGAALELARQVNELVDIEPVVARLQTDSDTPTRPPRKPKKPSEATLKAELLVTLATPVSRRMESAVAYLEHMLATQQRVHREQCVAGFSAQRPELKTTTIQSMVSRALGTLLRSGRLVKANGYYYKGDK